MEIQFQNKEVEVKSLFQWHTYEGLLEGLPHDKLNQRILDRVEEEATGLTHIKSHYLVEPEQTPLEGFRDYPFGKPMSLPKIICVAKLKGFGTSNPEIGGISELTLTFFQDSFAPPFDSKILDKLKELDWFSYAQDMSWDEF